MCNRRPATQLKTDLRTPWVSQITFLTNAKDSERLKLLKEVAGTTLYDEKKAESLKTLASAGMCLFVSLVITWIVCIDITRKLRPSISVGDGFHVV